MKGVETRALQAPSSRQTAAEQLPPQPRVGLGLSPAGMLGLQRTAGNAAAAAMVQRLVDEAAIRAEAERIWMRKGRPDQTAQESTSDWELATRNLNETEAEARRLWETKGSPAQSAVEQQHDWASARHTVRQRRLAEDVWRAKGAPQNQSAADQAADWATAGSQLEIEELWERCDGTIPLPGEAPGAVAARVTAAKAALVTKGYQLAAINALLRHDQARGPRPFVTVTAEDALGLGGHIVTKHVRNPARNADQERAWQAKRVVTHDHQYGGQCPGKAGSFDTSAAADTAVAAALKMLWRDFGWGTPNGMRNRLARGQTTTKTYTVSAPPAGFVQEKEPHTDDNPYPQAEWPAHMSANGPEMGVRPLFPGDPTPFPPMKNGTAIVPQPANPLTRNVPPTAVTIRVSPTSNAVTMGWYVNSAWPT